MINEIVFLFHSLIVAAGALGSLWLGQGALVAFMCIQCLLANIFVIKQTTLFGFLATCADPYTIGATLALNLLQEYYGKSAARQAIWANFYLLVLFVILGQINLWYVPHAVDTTQVHFGAIFALAPRIVTASFVVFLLVQFLDYYLYGFFKTLFADRYLVIRNYLSVALCQLVDTVLFSFLGLYGFIDDIWSVICISYAVKLIAIVLVTPLVAASKKVFRSAAPSY